MQNFRPLEQQEPLSGWPWSFHRNLWQRQNLHNRNIDSNANSIQTSTSPWRRFLLSQRPKILHGMFFYQASTVVRLVRAIVKVWGASRDVVFIKYLFGYKRTRSMKTIYFPFLVWMNSIFFNQFFFFSEGLHEIHPTRSIVACQNIFCFAAEQESPLKIMQPHSVFSFFYCKQIHLVTSYHVFYFFFLFHFSLSKINCWS